MGSVLGPPIFGKTQWPQLDLSMPGSLYTDLSEARQGGRAKTWQEDLGRACRDGRAVVLQVTAAVRAAATKVVGYSQAGLRPLQGVSSLDLV